MPEGSLYDEERSLLLRTLGNTAELRILDFLLDNPRFDFSRKEIREAIGSTKRTLSEKIPKLEEQGLIRVSRKIGRAKLYKINLENPAVQAFRTLERSLSLKLAEEYAEEPPDEKEEKIIVA
ncbi:MAG: winged helix-turn-helix domain-containing protein [Candidatus Aminicenantes bacterium]|nr:winged helix-turn-helix domain-containing protein [Candidatus Aminicenantes bacterium]